MSDLIDRQAAIDAMGSISDSICEQQAIDALCDLPSAQSDVAEKLHLYKCYITDKDGLQHEVIHTGDIRRVTGWEI